MGLFSGNDALTCNLLSDPLISTDPAGRHGAPGLFAAMARGEVRGFPALRPHQRAAWHMFLVQLAALALDRAGQADLPDTADRWATLLRGLTPEFPDDEPWRLVVADRCKPAFLQPTDPGGLKWTPVQTPDALDMLITSRNHDLKTAVAVRAEPEDWLYALVSLQTGEGQGGRLNYGIARMRNCHSSRVLLGLAPLDGTGAAPDPSAWWARDVRRLLDLRAEGKQQSPCTPGGDALLWLKPWPEGKQLQLAALDPWFIEICRRVRMTPEGAERATSKAARIDAKDFNGVVGDPWAPVVHRTEDKAARVDAKDFNGVVGDPWAPVVHRTEDKALTLGGGNFTYKRLCDLLIDGNWTVPELARTGPEDTGDMALVAAALSRGKGKTYGWKARVVPVPKTVAPGLFGPKTADHSKDMRDDIKKVDEVLKEAVFTFLVRVDVDKKSDKSDEEKIKDAKEEYEKMKPDEKRKSPVSLVSAVSAAFDRRVDALFFTALWDRIGAADKPAAVSRFQRRLVRIAEQEFETALPGIPCAALWRPRAEARARRAFHKQLRNIDTGRKDRDDAA